MNGKTGRPALRPSHSQNAVLVPASVNWNRRSVAEDPNSTHRPATTESIYNTTQQGTEHGHNQHEASAPFSHPQSVATHSSYPPAPPHPSSHPHSSSHTQSMPINSGNSYSDQEISYQSGSYAGSYDSSFGPNSPWIAPPSEGSYQQYQGHYSNMPASRIEEPILAPGEVPAPRPPMSYAALIGEALLHAPPPHQLYVSEISESIKRRYVCKFPYSHTHTHTRILMKQIIVRTLPRCTMVSDTRPRCAKPLSSFLDLSVINPVVLENGLFEPVAKHGSKTVDVVSRLPTT